MTKAVSNREIYFIKVVLLLPSTDIPLSLVTNIFCMGENPLPIKSKKINKKISSENSDLFSTTMH